MNKGYVSIVLHTHLPFIRHPDLCDPIEERWFFEAIHESYLPLIEILDKLLSDNIKFKIAMSLTPPIMAMLEDEYLNQRFLNHLHSLIELSEKEIIRTNSNNDINELAHFYNKRFKGQLEIYNSFNGNLMNAFRKFDKTGCVEMMASTATHALLPLFSAQPEVIKAQVAQGIKEYSNSFGHPPKGFWLPECAYCYGIDKYLSEAGIKYTICENKAVLYASPKPKYGSFAPIEVQSGLYMFPRDTESSRQVWSRTSGYPGDYSYREFYRDIGHALPLDYIAPYIQKDGIRVDTGIKYHRITGKISDKHIYNRKAALETALIHGLHFAESKNNQIKQVSPYMNKPPVIVCPYDTELFGHWWFEGPEFIDAFIRKSAEEANLYELTTPSQYIDENPEAECLSPYPSSWGANSDFSVWLSPSNDWIYRELFLCSSSLLELLNSEDEFSIIQKRALNQVVRELLLAQASDWPFILSQNTSAAYAVNRVNKHTSNFNRLYDGIKNNSMDLELLSKLENINNIFPDISYDLYKTGF